MCVQFVPDDCTEVAEVGDEVHVHYTVSIGNVHETKRRGNIFITLLYCMLRIITKAGIHENLSMVHSMHVTVIRHTVIPPILHLASSEQ